MIQTMVGNSMPCVHRDTDEVRIFSCDRCQEEEIRSNSNFIENLTQCRKSIFDSSHAVRQDTGEIFLNVNRETKGSHGLSSTANHKSCSATFSKARCFDP